MPRAFGGFMKNVQNKIRLTFNHLLAGRSIELNGMKYRLEWDDDNIEFATDMRNNNGEDISMRADVDFNVLLKMIVEKLSEEDMASMVAGLILYKTDRKLNTRGE